MGGCIIDFHVHPIDLFSERKLSVGELAEAMLKAMDEAGVSRILLYALEVDVERFRRVVRPSRVVKAVEDAVGWGLLYLPRQLVELMEEPERGLREHVSLLRRAHTPSERVLEAARLSGSRILAVASPSLSSGGLDEVLERVDKLLREGAVGVKVLPTVQLIDDRLRARLDYVADLLESRGRLLIIHTGCDPGVWELPLMCRDARPSLFEPLIRRHRSLVVVLAHMGAYSLLRPGIFMHEALDLMKRYENVYGDTAAVEGDLIIYAVRKVGAEKVLFGSDYPAVVGLSWRSIVESVKRLPLPREALERILCVNAEEILSSLKLKPIGC